MQLAKLLLATTLATVIGTVGASAQDAEHHPAVTTEAPAPPAPPATKPGQGAMTSANKPGMAMGQEAGMMQPGPGAPGGTDMAMMRECMGMMGSMMQGMAQGDMAASSAAKPGMSMGQGADMMQPGPGAPGSADMAMMRKCMGMMGSMMRGDMVATAPEDPVDGAFAAINRRMHRDMAVPAGGNPDVAFAQAMIAHHQGAIDMARVILGFGSDPEIRKLAQEVITAQQGEIAFLQQWLARQPKP